MTASDAPLFNTNATGLLALADHLVRRSKIIEDWVSVDARILVATPDELALVLEAIDRPFCEGDGELFIPYSENVHLTVDHRALMDSDVEATRRAFEAPF